LRTDKFFGIETPTDRHVYDMFWGQRRVDRGETSAVGYKTIIENFAVQAGFIIFIISIILLFRPLSRGRLRPKWQLQFGIRNETRGDGFLYIVHT
jgi:hypothetical protein